MYWDIFIMALAIYNSLSVPYEYCYKDEYFQIKEVVAFETMIDIIFLVDVFFTFFTSFVDRTGVENFHLEDIARNYITQPRFYVDTLPILGNSLFISIHRFFSLFGLFKIFRVFRIGQMITHSNVDDESKALMNMSKLSFYLLLYIHLLACGMWMACEPSQGKRYYRDWENNRYVSIDQQILTFENGTIVPVSKSQYMKFGKAPTFADDDWNRPTEKDMLGWKQYIEKWDSRSMGWYMPLSFVEPYAQELGVDSDLYTTMFRYLSLLYYGIINIGCNEFGPDNKWEYIFLIATLIISAMLKSVVFGDIAGLMQ